jgi:hypothetical protein
LSSFLAAASVGEILLVALLGCLLMPVVAWLAALGKGYLAPLDADNHQ